MKTPFLAFSGAAAICATALIVAHGSAAIAQNDKSNPVAISGAATPDYVIVVAPDAPELQGKVGKKLSEGFTLAGGVSVIVTPNQGLAFYQAIVRK